LKQKEIAIIEAAIKLYATKGFASTSIQEIVTESGISKGAFYLYFKSKDALLFAILEYYFETIERNLKAFENEDLPPREKFTKQLKALFSTLLEHKEFIAMQAREQAIPLNEQVKTLMLRKHYEGQKFYQHSLLAIYGEKIEHHLWDLSIILDGMFHSYMSLLIFDKEHFQIEDLVEYILRRMDSIVVGLEFERPVATKEKVEDLFKRTKAFFLKNNEEVINSLQQMKSILKTIEKSEDLQVSLEVLEAEIQNDNPRIPVIQGMLSNFKGLDKLDTFREQIAHFYNLKI
jgi:AcrR family transcriptional regulator